MKTILTTQEQARDTRHVQGVQFKCSQCEVIKDVDGSGYGYNADNQLVCYECCGLNDKAYMVTHGKYAGMYLNEKERTVGNWPGTLKFKLRNNGYIAFSWHNFAGKNGRADFWFNGPDGHVWHGVRIGDMDCCRVKRTKEKWQKDAT